MHALLYFFLCTVSEGSEAYQLMTNVDPKHWEIPAAVRQEPQDAIIVKSSTRVTDDMIHHYLLVHVLTNNARSNLQALDLGDHLIYLKGRVIDRSGRETLLDRDRDVTRILNFQTSQHKSHSVVVVPHGLTPDSLLELSWTEKAEYGLPLNQSLNVISISESMYCIEKTVEIKASTLYNFKSSELSDSAVELATRVVWTAVQAPIQFHVGELSGYTVLTYKNIPALSEAPFSDQAVGSGLTKVYMFRTTRFQGISVKLFWQNFTQLFLRPVYGEAFHRNSQYGAWIQRTSALTKQLNADEALTVFQEFRKQISRADRLDDMKRMGLTKLEHDNFGSSDLLNQIFEKRYADSYSMGLVFYLVLADLGYKPVLMFAPQPGMPFTPDSLNPFAIDFLHPIVAIKDKGAWYTFAPAATEYDSGHIPDHFRRIPLLVVDPANNFATSFTTLDRPSWKLNRLLQTYAVQVNANGAVKFNVIENRQGTYSAELRGQMEPLTDIARSDLMRAVWQYWLPDANIGATTIESLDDFVAKAKVNVTATRPPTIGKGRLIALEPFPGLQPVIPLPEYWPQRPRTEKIVLPENRGQASRATVSLPPGWRIKGQVDWAEANAIGKVSYKVAKEGDHYLVECQMIVEKSELEASDEPLLRQYCEWVERALDQRLAVVAEVTP